MLDRIIKIENIGRFENYSLRGDLALRQLNLIYGENGRGKTTLAAIFRSLVANDPNPILERKTAGCDAPAKVELRFSGVQRPIVFTEADNWSAVFSDFEVFDSVFVNENVYSGLHVAHEQKKRLYYFVIGAEGVDLAENVDDLDTEIRKTTRLIQEQGAKIERKIEWKGDVTDFVSLQEMTDIDAKIKAAQENVGVLRDADEIQKRSSLEQIDLPQYDVDELLALLGKTITDISQDAEEKTKEHLSRCVGVDNEKWVQQGLPHVKDGMCPFCGQSVEEVDLIRSYQDYFSAGYTSLKAEVAQKKKSLEEYFDEAILLRFRDVFSRNMALRSEWLEHISDIADGLDFDFFLKTWKTYFKHLSGLVVKKQNLPLDNVAQDEAKSKTHALDQELYRLVAEYNQWVVEINRRIQEFKASIKADDLPEAEDKLKLLQATKIRFSAEIDSLCQEFVGLSEAHKKLQAEKEKARAELTTFVETIFRSYFDCINRYLEKFGTGFRLNEMKTSFAGGKPSTAYGLSINDVDISLGSANTEGKPSFKSGLSDGDKNSLAFAFFLAKLDNDPDIANKIVVFDDPITSLDANRKNCTKQEIIKIAQKAKQVIVLSHDPHFLKILWDDKGSDAKTLHFSRKGRQSSSIDEWNIAVATQGQYFADYFRMVEFLENADEDLRGVARCIRPVLEGNLRARFPHKFRADKWLGDFIGMIRDAESGDQLERMKMHLDALTAINDYSQKYHHQSNPNADNEVLVETELESYIKQTIKIVSS